MKTHITLPQSSTRLPSLVTRLALACLLAVAVLAPTRAADTFVTTGSLATERSSHTATLLQNGKVLVVGGFGNAGNLATAEIFDPITRTWSATGSLATARYGHTATMLPTGKVLVAGGFGDSGYLATAELYDPATGTWTGTGSLATARYAHSATVLNSGKVLAAGGSNPGALASAELYDPATGAWGAAGSLVTARQKHTATLLPNGKVLVAGGSNGASGPLTSAELYDPASGANGTWSATGSLATRRESHTATLMTLTNGKVLVVGGYNGAYLNSAELYNPVTGTWSTTGTFSGARRFHTATMLPSGKVLIAGGEDAFGELNSARFYDPASNTWSSISSLNGLRQGHTATLLPYGGVLVTGGFHAGYLRSAELFDPASSGAWSYTDIFSGLATARSEHTATLLPNGKVLAAGGLGSNSSRIQSAELYDPATTSWSSTGLMSTPRSGHTATLLPTGKVLVVGGLSNVGLKLDSAELYDPTSGTWSGSGSLGIGHYLHTATLLPNGKVLVVGGSNGSASGDTVAELYDPFANGGIGNWSTTASLATGRSEHTATLLPNGKVLVVGGGNTASAELYDPFANGGLGSWSTTSSLAIARSGHTATLLPNGKVLVAGGSNGTSGFLATAELYDPATGTWTGTGSLATARYGHSATVLNSGTVLVAGGYNNTTGNLTSAELYNPFGNGGFASWSTTASLASARARHSATLLPNGRVLVAGGVAAGLPGSELYYLDLGFSPFWQPEIVQASFDANARLVLFGNGFRGISGASGGNGSQDSPTDYPLVQLRRLDNDQITLLLPDPRATFTANPFTASPLATIPAVHHLVTVFVNGIPSAAFILLPSPDISVEQPAGAVIADGGARSFVATVSTPQALIFKITNRGPSNLTGLAITKDGANAADFTVTSSPTASLAPGGSTTFTLQFTPTTTGAKAAAIHLSNNVPGKNPYDINLTGQVLTYATDSDADGMNDAAEFDLAALGFDWQVSQPALVNTLFTKATGAGLYTASQVQALNVGVPLLQRNPTTGLFKLTIGTQVTSTLQFPFADFPMNAPGTSVVINGAGKLEFQFSAPVNAAFFRVESQ